MQTVTLTFNLATWFLFAAHYLVRIIICAALFLNPTMHYKVMGLTRTGFTEVYAQSLSTNCDLDLRPSDTVLVRDTLSCYDNFLGLFFNDAMHYKVMGQTRIGFNKVYALSLTTNCDLDFSPSDMVLVRDTLSCYDNYLGNIFKIPLCITKLWARHEQVSLKSMHKV